MLVKRSPRRSMVDCCAAGHLEVMKDGCDYQHIDRPAIDLRPADGRAQRACAVAAIAGGTEYARCIVLLLHEAFVSQEEHIAALMIACS